MTNKNIKNNGIENITRQSIQAISKPPIQNTISTQYNTRYELITLQRELLNERYCTDGMFRTIVEQPVLDGLRGELEIKSELISIEEIKRIKSYFINNNIIDKVKQLFIWDRLFGGAGLIIDIDGVELYEELDIDNIKEGTKINFIPCDRWELSSSYVGNNVIYNKDINSWGDFIYYNEKVANNRVIVLTGKEAPSLIRTRLSGWGLSVVEPLIAPLNAFDKTKNLIYEIIDEAKIDVFKINGLNDSAISGQDEDVVKRIELANLTKNYNNAVVLDNEDDYIQKQLNLGGVSEILQQLRLEIAGAMKMPLTKIFGMSASGFNSGEDDIENYNNWVNSELRTKIYEVLKKVIIIISKSLFGVYLNDLDVSLPDLKIISSSEKEQSKMNNFKIGMDLYNNKLLTSKELADYLYQEKIMVMNTKAKNGELPEFAEGMQAKEYDNLDI